MKQYRDRDKGQNKEMRIIFYLLGVSKDSPVVLDAVKRH